MTPFNIEKMWCRGRSNITRGSVTAVKSIDLVISRMGEIINLLNA